MEKRLLKKIVPQPSLKIYSRLPLIKIKVQSKLCLGLLIILSFYDLVAQSIEMKITQPYLNIPIGSDVRAKMMEFRVNGKLQREFPIQLAEDMISYWLYADVSAFKGQIIFYHLNKMYA